MKKSVLLLVFLTGLSAFSELRLNGLFTDNMVLQRGRLVPVWGTADPGATVTVEFGGQKKTAVADSSKHWKILLDPMKASSTPAVLHAESSIGNQQSSIGNVLIGDVWLCTGQSNMAQTMKRYLIWDQVKDGFKNDQLRFFKIKEGGVGAPEPSKELVIDRAFNNSWQSCTPEFAAEFSATAGFFGMKLHRDLGVPVGLLYANRGGTRANMWIPRSVLESKNIYARFLDESNVEWKATKKNPDAIRAPSHLYNGTIHPLAPFAIKGCIWYQGESDTQFSEIYTESMSDLVAAWRAEWGIDFPFLFVQLAPYSIVPWDQTGEAWAWLRDAQFQCLEKIPNSGMAVIIDGGEATDIHPQAKDLPGERLALLAAGAGQFPRFGKMTVDGGKARISFEGSFQGLETRRVAMNTERGHLHGQGPNAVVAEADELKGFTICGADQTFVEAQARIVSEHEVEVWSSDVTDPVAVRYGWSNFPLCNLYCKGGMPVSPFRTDSFERPNFTGEKTAEPFEGVRAEWGRAMEMVPGGDGNFHPLEKGGVRGAKAEGAYLYFRAPELNEPRAAVARVVFLDKGYGTIQMRYDSTDSKTFAGKIPGRWKPAGEVKCNDSNHWKIAVFDLPDGKFAKRLNGGDIRLQSNGALIVNGIYLEEK